MNSAQAEQLFKLAQISYQKTFDSMIEQQCTIALKRFEQIHSNQLGERIGDNQLVVYADFTGDLAGSHFYIFPKEIFDILPNAEEEGQEDQAMSTLTEIGSMMLAGFCGEIKQKYQLDLSYAAPRGELVNAETLTLPAAEVQLINYTLISGELNLSWWEICETNWLESLLRLTNSTKGSQSTIHGVNFPQFDVAHLNPQEQKNLGLLMDVPMVVTVELGRTRWQLRDVLTIGEGSIVELDKQAGEQVDILVNNNLVARGEVVVLDENFSVRITEIISSIEQMMQRIE